MKTNILFQKVSRGSWTDLPLILKNAVLIAFALLFIQGILKAQDTYTRPTWYFGVAGGANFNFYHGTTQKLNADLTVPRAFHDGSGTGLYLAALTEFHKPGTLWGGMLQAGLDGRQGKFKQVTNPCNCPADLSTNLNYLTVEPSIRLAPFKGNLYFYLGPRVAFNLSKSFTYKVGINPEYPSQPLNPDIKTDMSDAHMVIISGQIGAGYDIFLTSMKRKTQFVISPFVAFHPYFGQDPRSVESWNITTLRAGIALKLGSGHLATEPQKKEEAPVVVPVKAPETKFTVVAPKNVPVVHRTRETFPIRNYIFFDLGSTSIPDRYVVLNKNQVKDFKEDQLEVFTPKNLTGRSARQMTVYYNVLNILGDRMGKNPDATIVLVGSSEKGPDDGREMAQSVKNYLVDVFGINEKRISIEGRDKPKIPSEQPGAANDLELLRAGDRRVSIESSSPALLMEFQSGPEAPLKPVEIIQTKESIDSSITFTLEGAKVAYKSWMIEVKDEKGVIKNYGPFTEDLVSIPVRTILETRDEGDYTVTVIATTKDNKIIKKTTTTHLVNYTPPRIEEGMRYSVLFEFNESKTILLYDKYLTEVVAPKIPFGGRVIIHGHTDIIGDDVYNQTLSLARANDIKAILEKALSKANRSDVTFEVEGYGEDVKEAPFENKYPEERFYNRTVIVDILTTK